MKRIIFVFVLLGVVYQNYYSQNIAITDDNGYTANTSAMLDVKSVTKGMLVPRMTTSQRNAIVSPANGLLVFDTNENVFYFYTGTVWTNLSYGQLWSKNGNYVYLSNTDDNVGIGVTDPNNKLLVKADASTGIDESIFAVLNNNGDTVFAVYEEGVRIWVDDNGGTKANGSRGGFAVGGYSPTKAGFTNEYLRVTPDSVRIYIDETYVAAKANGSRGGFAVGGFNPAKGAPSENYMIVSLDTTETVNPSEPRILWYPTKEALLSGRVLIEDRDSVGLNSFASGFESKAMGDYSHALGFHARAHGNNSAAIGNYANAQTNNSFAFGDYAQAKGLASYAIGSNSVASGDYSTAFGFDNNSSGNFSTSFGKGTTASGQYSFSAGYNSVASGYNSYALGLTCSATATSSFSTGYLSNATAVYSYAMGYQATASNSYAYALGYNATADGQYSFAQGNGVQALNTGSIAMGYSALSNGNYGVAIGYNSEASTDGVAMGRDATATGSSAFALGYSTSSTATGSYAIGYNATASGNYSTAMGYSSTASASDAVAIGRSAIANGLDGVAIGRTADATWGGVALGLFSDAGTGSWATALGANSEATGAYSVAIGGGTSSGSGSKSIGLITASGFYSFGIALDAGLGTTNVAQDNAMAIMGGRVGINELTPNSRLHVFTDEANWVARFWNDGNSTTRYGIRIQGGADDASGTNYLVHCYDGDGNLHGGLAIVNATVSVVQNSDRNLKENIIATEYNGLNILNGLQVVDYNYISCPSFTHVGYIAQDAEKVFPAMIVKDDATGIYGMDMTRLIPVMNKAIQEQQEIIESLQKEIDELKQRLDSSQKY